MATHLGFDAIGLIFAESPRRIDPDEAKRICGSVGSRVLKVGVFVNEERAEVESMGNFLGLDLFQFHGDEDPSYVAAFGMRAIKAFSGMRELDAALLRDYPPCFAFLIDARDPVARGGTGKLADWPTATRLALEFPVILAGGLGPENVEKAISEVRPFGLDVSSGLESSPGVKDIYKMKRYVRAVKLALEKRRR
jgi:phosphoribosylanthranilate isomerase